MSALAEMWLFAFLAFVAGFSCGVFFCVWLDTRETKEET